MPPLSLEAKLGKILEKYVTLSRFKIATLLWLCQSILIARNVCLQKVAQLNAAVSGEEKTYRQRLGKLRRFFQTGNVDALLEGIFLTIVSLLPNLDKAHLVIDRTNWALGGRNYNFLTLGLVYEGCLLPLLWQELGYKGNSNFEQQLGLMRRLLALYPPNRPMPQWHIKADREFIHARWLLELEKQGIYYVIRFKDNARLDVWKTGGINKKKRRLRTLRRYMQRYQLSHMEVVIADEVINHLVVVPNSSKQANIKEADQYIYLITNLPTDLLSEVSRQYRMRWKIECCFKHLKSNGFQLENLQLPHQHQANLLMGCLVLVYVLSILTGLIAQTREPTKIIHYANGSSYPAYSTFTIGISILCSTCFTLKHFINLIDWFLKAKYKIEKNKMTIKIMSSF